MLPSSPSTRSVLSALTKQRLAQVGRVFDLGLPPSGAKDQQIEALIGAGRVRFRPLLEHLRRDELRAVCRRAHGLDDEPLAARMLEQWRGLSAAGLIRRWAAAP